MVWRRPTENDNYPPWIQKQETIVLCHPGQSPEDVIHTDFLTLANFNGESHTYEWEEELRSERNAQPQDPTIQVVNLRSQHKPFIIFEPGSRKGYIGGNPGLFSRFSTCNHWPVAQISSDGRDAQAPDRASSFLGTTTSPILHEGPDLNVWASWMYGMTEKPAAELASLGRSWALAPELTIAGDAYENQGYDLSQRAYVLKYQDSDPSLPLQGKIAAGPESPLANACLRIKAWGNRSAGLKVDGKEMRSGQDFRLGHVRTLEGTDLIVWIQKSATRPFQLVLEPLD
jgi:hypothetical protein